MQPGELRVLCVHGVGGHPRNGPWERTWRKAIQGECKRWNPELKATCKFVHYDDIFNQDDIELDDVMRALWKLIGSGVGSLFRRRRGLLDSLDRIPQRLRWTAGMVVQWVENEKLRAQLRERLHQDVKKHKPDVICAHSLGSLICYDEFSTSEGRETIKHRTFISLGSQIGSPFVRDQFLAGRIAPLVDDNTPSKTRNWYHLYNPNDSVFTAPISLSHPSFEQVIAEFDVPGFADHDAEEYLSHANVSNTVWRELATAAGSICSSRRSATFRCRVT